MNGTIISSHLIIPTLGLSFALENQSKLPDKTEIDGFRVTAHQLLGPMMVVDDIKPLLQELTHKMQFFEDSILLRTA